MKVLIRKCDQCKAVKKRSLKKNSRIQTYQVRAAKSCVREMLKRGEWEDLPEKIKVDYYG